MLVTLRIPGVEHSDFVRFIEIIFMKFESKKSKKNYFLNMIFWSRVFFKIYDNSRKANFWCLFLSETHLAHQTATAKGGIFILMVYCYNNHTPLKYPQTRKLLSIFPNHVVSNPIRSLSVPNVFPDRISHFGCILTFSRHNRKKECILN